MGMLHIFERGGDDVRRFDEAMKRAKSGLMEACEIWQDMKDQFSYGERDDYSERSRSMRRDEIGEWGERRGRDSMGRYR